MKPNNFKQRVAVIGSGISGLSCAYRLAQDGHQVTLFEAGDYFGGHTHTVDVSLGGITYGVDTGFLVFNHRTYPNLVNLFNELEIETVATDMSFSVKLPFANRTLEWSGGNLNTVFAQRRNLFNPKFIRMLRDILRFNEQTTLLAKNSSPELHDYSLGVYLSRHDYSEEFRDWYLLPMAGCIWSCPTEQMLAFPLSTFISFCHNHGLLQVNNRPKWWTVKGGAKHYVEKLLIGISDKRLNTPVLAVYRNQSDSSQVRIESASSSELFDQVVMAGHSDQSLALLKDATADERDVLSAIGYQPNVAVLHTDTSFLPENKSTWSAWMQPLPFKESVIVSLNPIDAPSPDKIIATFDYAHPVFDNAAIAAQQKLPSIQGKQNTWFAGAWTGYGFHEDGLKSGIAVAEALSQLGGSRD